jgi:hypothetical protein
MRGHAGDPETDGPMGQVGDWVIVAFLYCLRVEMSLRCKQKFPRKKKGLLDQLSPLGTSYSPSFITIVFLLLYKTLPMIVNCATAGIWIIFSFLFL